MKTIIAAVALAGLLGCSTTPEPQDVVAFTDLDERSIHWSSKSAGYADGEKDISVLMNTWGLLYLKVDGKVVAQTHNWCVRVVDSQ